MSILFMVCSICVALPFIPLMAFDAIIRRL